MAYNKVDYEDVRVPLGDWPGTLKEELGGTALPVIAFQDGSKYNQAQTIMRYLGMKTGCYPTDPAVAYDNDRICEDWNDYIGGFGGVFFKKPEDRPEAAAAIWTKAEAFAESLRPFLEKKTTGFLFGDKPMTADFWVGNLCVTYGMNFDLFGEAPIKAFFAKYPWLEAYGKRFYAANKAYLDSRPKCPF